MFLRIFFTSTCIINLALAFSQDKNQVNYTIQSGLPSNTVYCVTQDDQGFLWFGTDAGLCRFDGIEFRKYGLNEGLPGMDILNFFKDSMGRIWFYTFNGKVGFLKDGKLFNSKNNQVLKNADFSTRITNVVEVNDRIYISSQNHGIKILEETGVVDSIKLERTLHFLAKIKDQCYWVAIDQEDLKYDYLSVEGLIEGEKNNNLDLEYLIQIGRNYLAYVRSRGKFIFGIKPNFLLRIDTNTGSLKRLKIRDYTLYNLKEINDKSYLLTSEGVKILNEETLEIVNFVSYKETTDLTFDNEGNLWVSTLNNGVIFYPKNEVFKINEKKYSFVKGLYALKDSLYFFHTSNKAAYITDHGLEEELFSIPMMLNLKSLYVDSLKNVWSLSSSGLRKNTSMLSYAYERANTSYLNRNNFIYNYDGTLEYLNLHNGRNVVFEYSDLGKIWDFEFISKNKILIASSNGLFLMDLNDVKVSNFKSFENFQITAMSIDKFDNLWFATNGNGLLRFKKNRIGNLEADQLEDYRVVDYSDVYGKILIVDSILYASNPKGVSKIYFNREAILGVSHISESNGLSPARVNDLEFFNNKVYVAQDNGLFCFNHDQSFNEQMSFPVIIDEIVVADSSFVVTDDLMSFPYDVGTIQLNIKTIYFKDHKNLTYQFRIFKDNEVEPNWSNSPNSEFIFSKLTSGQYTFQVRVKTLNSDWSSPKVLNFQIENIYWRTLWFKVLLASLSLMFFFIIYVNYIRSRERRRTLSREKISSDLKALKAQINPHFLFNSLNSIQSFILEENHHLAEEYLVKYSKLMRTILNHSNVLTVPINDEIVSIKLYVELERLRLAKPLDFKISVVDLDPRSENVPSMIIQPLIENAIWHGIQTVKQNGKIRLKFEKKVDRIQVTIEDNGVGLSPNNNLTKSEPHGVQLVKERIQLVNRLKNIKSNFRIESGKNGTRITFSYPIDLN